MHFYIITIFPELFESRSSTALFGKAVNRDLVKITYINPRQFTTDRHQTVDSKIYGWWEWLLLKAKPLIDAVNYAIWLIHTEKDREATQWQFQIIYPSPSTSYFDQRTAFDLATEKNIILVCGRYEGIDYRFEQYFVDLYPDRFHKISLGKYVVYGWEVPSMMIMEAITRLLPGGTHKPPITESYYPTIGENAIENPHFTRPQEVYGYNIPDILISGHHKNIDKRREDNITDTYPKS